MAPKRNARQTERRGGGNGARLPVLALALLAGGCAANPAVAPSSSTASQQQLAASLMGARIVFHYDDFYSLTAPIAASSCAGDAKTYFDPFALSGASPQPFPQSVTTPGSTLQPAWIKNVSVDLTDSNANVPSNLAFTCSYGNGAGTPPPSSCATFDYGAIGGVPTTMGGTLLLIGGIQGFDYAGIEPEFPVQGISTSCGAVLPGAGYSSCPASAYALGVNSLPATAATDPPNALAPGLTASTGPISTWADISGAAGYSGPLGLAGAAAAYDPGLQQLLIFGGSSPVSGVGPTGPAITTSNSWSFNIKTQQWSLLTANVYNDISILRMLDTPAGGTTVQLAEPSGGRASFGYAPVQGISLTQMSTTGVVAALNNPPTPATENVDRTDRIAVAGGITASGRALSDTHKFNPTFGPEWVDLIATQNPMFAALGYTPQIVQWMDSYETQLMNNSALASQLNPAYVLGGGLAAPDFGIGFGMAAIRNNANGFGAGYLVTAGGFDSRTTVNTPQGGPCPTLASCGAMTLNSRLAAAPGTGGEGTTANYIGIPDLIDAMSYEATPAQWNAMAEAGGASTVPWYGGASMLPGFSLQNNDVVYFGGADCAQYLTNPTAACNFTNPGRYWSFTTNPLGAGFLTPAAAATAGVFPTNAGMAAARGLDPAGNVIVVALGGVSAAASATDTSVYVLFNNGGTPTWTAFALGTGVLGTPPKPLADAALVFSHVTHKFYLFGGYSPQNAFLSSDTWELSVTGGACTATAGSCAFSWRQLDVPGGLACFPSTCPQGRHGHRMAEVNYFNRDPGGLISGTGENVCNTAGAPCSFGIFMEGGTPDNVNYLADRWMFDPTANGGYGAWLQTGDLPPRALASMATVDYTIPTTTQTVHRAILFGGELGLASPEASTAGNYYVAPTLGDTWMYDFDNNTWNRVMLAGQGYNGAVPAGTSEFTAREGYNAAAGGEIAENSPPALAGAVMVTRTLSGPTLGATTQVPPLAIPQVFLFGGRTKDGKFLPIDHVYKFCAGSTGEKPFPASPNYPIPAPNDGSCDAFDPVANPNSPSPVMNYVGRWLRKTPTGASIPGGPAAIGAFMGAGAYDSLHDRIVLFGGRSFNAAANTGITDLANTSAQNTIFEYTPPAAYGDDGSWAAVPPCADSPVPPARYGHSLGYDPANQQLVLTGGYDTDGNPLVQTQTYSDGTLYPTPDVWVAKRVDSPTACYTWSQITLFGNSIYQAGQTPPFTGIGNAASVYIPSSGYNTGYYSMFDAACEGEGPINTADPTVNKLLAGGVYIDIDRTQLGPNENLLLNLTFIPLGDANQGPGGSLLAPTQAAYFRVHLARTGQSAAALQAIFQPRYLTYADSQTYPTVAQDIAIVAPSTGQIRQEQVLLPISMDPTIDRIRIERYSGTGILVDASIHRMGYR